MSMSRKLVAVCVLFGSSVLSVSAQANDSFRIACSQELEQAKFQLQQDESRWKTELSEKSALLEALNSGPDKVDREILRLRLALDGAHDRSRQILRESQECLPKHRTDLPFCLAQYESAKLRIEVDTKRWQAQLDTQVKAMDAFRAGNAGALQGRLAVRISELNTHLAGIAAQRLRIVGNYQACMKDAATFGALTTDPSNLSPYDAAQKALPGEVSDNAPAEGGMKTTGAREPSSRS
jgi:hypothetical protein